MNSINNLFSMWPLILSILPFIFAPLVFEKLRNNKKIIDFLDGFIFTSIIGLLLLHLFVDSEIPNYFTFIPALIIGFCGPNIFEKALARQRRRIHLMVLLFSMIGFMVHSMADGIALSEGTHDHGEILSLQAAILLHRIPDALTIWWLFAPAFGSLLSSVFILILIAATASGFFFGDVFNFASFPEAFSCLQAFVVGTILHVVVFRFHSDSFAEENSCCHGHEAEESKEASRQEGLGSLLGFILFLVFIYKEQSEIAEFIQRFLAIFYASAPALLFAYLVSSLISIFFKQNWFDWASSGGRFSQAVKGMIVGLPLPVCSCGVLPFYKTLVKRGVPAAAAVAFLIATPELGVDALLISFPMLGGELTLIRLGAAVIFAVSVALAVDYKSAPITEKPEEAAPLAWKERITKGFKAGFVDLFDSTIPWIAAGILLAALIEPLLNGVPLSLPYGLDVVVFAIIGAVFYVCASGATPLVAVFILNGLSAGAAITFLLTGPATNISTFGILSEMHGRKFAIRFSIAVATFAVIIGYLVNFFFPSISIPPSIHQHEHLSQDWRKYSAILITLLFLAALFRNGGRNLISRLLRA